jgi:hypothetical protein
VRLLLVQLPCRSLLLVRLLHVWLIPRTKRLLVQFVAVRVVAAARRVAAREVRFK